MTFPYVIVPIPTNNPSQDVGGMNENAISINNWVQVDHVGFNTSIAGQHTKVTLSQFTMPSTQTDPSSVFYSSAGTANVNSPQLFFKNSQAVFHMSPIRAWAYCNSSGIISSQSYNIGSFSNGGTGEYSIILEDNAVNSNKFTVLISSTQDSGFNQVVMNTSNYGFVGGKNGTFGVKAQRTNGTFTDPSSFGFIVLQL